MERMPVFCSADILIAGCGNVLFGDDGFGPEVIDYLEENYSIPEHVAVMDVGTGIRRLLFTISLSEKRPHTIVIIDAVDKGREPGDIFDISLEEVPIEKIDDFSMHQVPSSNLLKELQDLCQVKVDVKVCQIESIPDEMRSGLSAPMKKAVPALAKKIAEEYF